MPTFIRSLAEISRPKLILALLLVPALATLSSGPQTAADEPPRPVQRFSLAYPITTVPAQYELFEQVLDLAPGASTGLHQHMGRAFVLVIDGDVTLTQDGVDTVYHRGQGFSEAPGSFHSLSNKARTGARLFMTVLQSPGQPSSLPHPGVAAPQTTPVVVAAGRTVLGTQPSEFSLVQSVVDFGPGAVQPLHQHGGVGLVLMLDGEVAFTAAGQERRLTRGGTFADIGDPHDARNLAPGVSTTVVTFLVRKGEAQTTFLTPSTPATSPAPAVRPPSTGDGGLITR